MKIDKIIDVYLTENIDSLEKEIERLRARNKEITKVPSKDVPESQVKEFRRNSDRIHKLQQQLEKERERE